MKLNPPNAHRSQIKICEKRQTRNVQFRFMPNAFRILKPIQKSSKCVWVGANAFTKNQTRLAYEDKRDLYCTQPHLMGIKTQPNHHTCIASSSIFTAEYIRIHTDMWMSMYSDRRTTDRTFINVLSTNTRSDIINSYIGINTWLHQCTHATESSDTRSHVDVISSHIGMYA